MVFKGLFGKDDSGEGGEIDLEDYLNDLSIRDGKIIESDNLTYVKPVLLDPEGKGVGAAIAELEKGNIVVLNVKALLHNKVLLREIVRELRDACVDLDGDIGKISTEKILLVASGYRISHTDAAAAEARPQRAPPAPEPAAPPAPKN